MNGKQWGKSNICKREIDATWCAYWRLSLALYLLNAIRFINASSLLDRKSNSRLRSTDLTYTVYTIACQSLSPIQLIIHSHNPPKTNTYHRTDARNHLFQQGQESTSNKHRFIIVKSTIAVDIVDAVERFHSNSRCGLTATNIIKDSHEKDTNFLSKGIKVSTWSLCDAYFNHHHHLPCSHQ